MFLYLRINVLTAADEDSGSDKQGSRFAPDAQGAGRLKRRHTSTAASSQKRSRKSQGPSLQGLADFSFAEFIKLEREKMQSSRDSMELQWRQSMDIWEQEQRIRDDERTYEHNRWKHEQELLAERRIEERREDAERRAEERKEDSERRAEERKADADRRTADMQIFLAPFLMIANKQ